jgi:hypothetical protein
MLLLSNFAHSAAQGLLSKVAFAVAPWFDDRQINDLKAARHILAQFKNDLEIMPHNRPQLLERYVTNLSSVKKTLQLPSSADYMKQTCAAMLPSLMFGTCPFFIPVSSTCMDFLIALGILEIPPFVNRLKLQNNARQPCLVQPSPFEILLPSILVFTLIGLNFLWSLHKQCTASLQDIHRHLNIIERAGQDMAKALSIRKISTALPSEAPLQLQEVPVGTVSEKEGRMAYILTPFLFERQKFTKIMLTFNRATYKDNTITLRVHNSNIVSTIQYHKNFTGTFRYTKKSRKSPSETKNAPTKPQDQQPSNVVTLGNIFHDHNDSTIIYLKIDAKTHLPIINTTRRDKDWCYFAAPQGTYAINKTHTIVHHYNTRTGCREIYEKYGYKISENTHYFMYRLRDMISHAHWSLMTPPLNIVAEYLPSH